MIRALFLSVNATGRGAGHDANERRRRRRRRSRNNKNRVRALTLLEECCVARNFCVLFYQSGDIFPASRRDLFGLVQVGRGQRTLWMFPLEEIPSRRLELKRE